MQNVEQDQTKAFGLTCYASLDLTQTYWILLVHEDSIESKSFLTREGAFTSMRVPHGTTNAVLHLESFFKTQLLSSLKKHVILWVNYCLLNERSVDNLVNDVCLFRFLALTTTRS